MFSTNGSVGMNFEHAWGDGVAVMRYIDEVIEDSQNNDFVTQVGDWNGNVELERLEIKTDDKIREAVKESKKRFRAKCDSVTYHNFKLEGVGKNDCKKSKVGPDSFMQAAFQIAYFKLYGKFVPTYESCSTAIFKHGRTETMRPCTEETAALTKAMTSGSTGSKEILSLLQAASKKHFELTKLAAQGQGWDRHFFALRTLANSSGQEMPKIFQDESYLNINQNVLSTSTLSTSNITGGAFCPVVPNGFGLGYAIREDGLGANISSFKELTNGNQFSEALQETFREMGDIIKTAQ